MTTTTAEPTTEQLDESILDDVVKCTVAGCGEDAAWRLICGHCGHRVSTIGGSPSVVCKGHRATFDEGMKNPLVAAIMTASFRCPDCLGPVANPLSWEVF